ncbi:hypothetical protein [Streptomyces sp. Rer75]|nr:hypothetical protein [Streptomyces sp. Rer75]
MHVQVVLLDGFDPLDVIAPYGDELVGLLPLPRDLGLAPVGF